MTEDKGISTGRGSETDRRGWWRAALVGAILIVLSVPLYTAKTMLTVETKTAPAAEFVGGESCRECHEKEYEKWAGSHHDLAMDVATEETVLGDFDEATFEYEDVRSRFYRNDGKFYVNTEGPDGRMDDFEITHVFGVYPLQQYLVPFPGGRLQCLSIGWDVERREWYRLPPYDVEGPEDWLHWTKAAQNWNGMCAECHSTNLQKSYNYKEDSYKTSWTDIDVNCEACHGPGSLHIEWADRPAMALEPVNNFALVARTSGISSRDYVELCAYCHSRRSALGPVNHFAGHGMDGVVPSLLTEALYYPDGQILEEVYVYGSFTQSKMYLNGVRCSDCHDSHSLELHDEGNDLCLRCHREDTYNTADHHFHKETHEGLPSDGWLCVKCHMPGRDYMGIDNRADHSIRVPRPDLSREYEAPNACNSAGCHDDQTLQWSLGHYRTWYGQKRKPHYGTAIDAGRKAQADAQEDLVRLADDALMPVFARATALSLLDAYPGELSRQARERALVDDEAVMRHTAVVSLERIDPDSKLKLIAPLLYDPVRAVRLQAAVNLASAPVERLNLHDRAAFEDALNEYIRAMEYSADFSASRHNLGNVYSKLGQLKKAEEHYEASIRIDDQFYPAKVNLAILYNQMGKNDEAEALLRDVLDDHPDFHETSYSLALLLAEKGQYEEAVTYFVRAVEGMPRYGRAYYNFALVLQRIGNAAEAERVLTAALDIDPGNHDFLYALADLHLKQGNLAEAGRIARKMVEIHPSSQIGGQLLELIDRMSQEGE